MRRKMATLATVVLLVCISIRVQAADFQKLRLLPGHSEVLEVTGVDKLAIGNPDIIQAKLLDSSQLLVNAVGTGHTNLLLIGSETDIVQRIAVEVSPWQLREVQDYVKYLVGKNIKVIEVNGQVFVSGVVDGDPDFLSQAIAQRFPGVAVRLNQAEPEINMSEVVRLIHDNFDNSNLTLKSVNNDITFLSGQVNSSEEYQRIEKLIQSLPVKVTNLVKISEPTSTPPDNSDIKNSHNLIELLGSVWPNLRFVEKGHLVAIRGTLLPDEFQSYQQMIHEQVEQGRILSLVQPIVNEEPPLPDSRPQQIRVRLHLLELNRQDLSELGFDWDNSITVKAEETNRGLFQLGSFVRDGDLVSRLRLMSSNGKVRILAEPELTTVEGVEANIHVGGEIPVGDSEGIQWKEYGIKFTITPELALDQRIRMKVQAEVSSLDWTNLIELGESVLPAISSSSFSTVLSQPSGTSTALGGILERRTGRTQNGIPGLSSLPIVGEIFSWDKTELTERELVAIVSAHLIDEESDNSANTKEEGISVREDGAQLPNDFGI